MMFKFFKEINLSYEEISGASSDYIRKGRLKEEWKINKVTLKDKSAVMYVEMTNLFCDKNDFHLSIYLAEEMASQLMIISGHIWSGLKEKNKEVWMIESSTKNIKPIRDTNFIEVNLNLVTLRKFKGKILGIGEFKITDKTGGLIKITQKGMLS